MSKHAMTQHETQLASLDASTLAEIRGGLSPGKIWQATKNAYGKAAPVIKDVAKKVGPFLLPANRAHNIYERATDGK